MPTVTAVPQKGYAFCTDARCPGYHQEEVDAIQETTAWTYGERGGDGAFAGMTENTSVDYRFSNQDDVPCPACEAPRNISGTPRPQYQPLSGKDPMGLLGAKPFDASKVFDPKDAELQELRDKSAALEAKLDALLGALEEDGK